VDRLTHISITNCIKELDALEKLVVSEQFNYQQVADWITEISWNLANIFNRRRYDSDEFQHRLKKLVQEQKRAFQKTKKEDDENAS
jgi:hypothetical protein